MPPKIDSVLVQLNEEASRALSCLGDIERGDPSNIANDIILGTRQTVGLLSLGYEDYNIILIELTAEAVKILSSLGDTKNESLADIAIRVILETLDEDNISFETAKEFDKPNARTVSHDEVWK